MATILVTLWIVSGLASLRSAAVRPEGGAEGLFDYLLAGSLGPFTVLLTGLAEESSSDPDRE